MTWQLASPPGKWFKKEKEREKPRQKLQSFRTNLKSDNVSSLLPNSLGHADHPGSMWAGAAGVGRGGVAAVPACDEQKAKDP